MNHFKWYGRTLQDHEIIPYSMTHHFKNTNMNQKVPPPIGIQQVSKGHAFRGCAMKTLAGIAGEKSINSTPTLTSPTLNHGRSSNNQPKTQGAKKEKPKNPLDEKEKRQESRSTDNPNKS